MESTADRYRRLRTAFAERIASVPAGRWDSPSPCEGWTATDVVGHVVETQGMFEGLVGRTLRPGPDVAVDALGAFTTATDQVQAHLEDPQAAAAEYEGAFGHSTFAEAVEQFLCFDLVVHGWDLARAAGIDDRIAPEDVAWVRAATDGMGEAMRSPGVCGPEVSVPADASEQDKLLAFLGRTP